MLYKAECRTDWSKVRLMLKLPLHIFFFYLQQPLSPFWFWPERPCGSLLFFNTKWPVLNKVLTVIKRSWNNVVTSCQIQIYQAEVYIYGFPYFSDSLWKQNTVIFNYLIRTNTGGIWEIKGEKENLCFIRSDLTKRDCYLNGKLFILTAVSYVYSDIVTWLQKSQGKGQYYFEL